MLSRRRLKGVFPPGRRASLPPAALELRCRGLGTVPLQSAGTAWRLVALPPWPRGWDVPQRASLSPRTCLLARGRYDDNGANYKVQLHANVDLSAPPKVDELPKDLCDKWAWVRWDFVGRQPHTDAAAHSGYDQGVQEMRELINKGRTLDELWRVAE